MELTRAKKKIEESKNMTVGKRKKYFECSLKNHKRIKLFLQCYLKKFMESFGLDIINMKVIKLI